jgi:hypothetical protein
MREKSVRNPVRGVGAVSEACVDNDFARNVALGSRREAIETEKSRSGHELVDGLGMEGIEELARSWECQVEVVLRVVAENLECEKRAGELVTAACISIGFIRFEMNGRENGYARANASEYVNVNTRPPVASFHPGIDSTMCLSCSSDVASCSICDYAESRTAGLACVRLRAVRVFTNSAIESNLVFLSSTESLVALRVRPELVGAGWAPA